MPGTGEEKKIHCPDPLAMGQVARWLAPLLMSSDVLLLYGDLGAGKTTFVQYLAQALGVGEDQYVSSPSFALLHEYTGCMPIFHMDLYRLADEEEVEAAGLGEYFDSPGLILVEWPQRLATLLPDTRLEIHINIQEDQSRQLILRPLGQSWQQRIASSHKKTLQV